MGPDASAEMIGSFSARIIRSRRALQLRDTEPGTDGEDADVGAGQRSARPMAPFGCGRCARGSKMDRSPVDPRE
ncbi:hypothetical protein MHOL44478_15005 [Mycobacterium holsaticum DSM 44478]|nr:hypothetical protein [Mycolicibacterium holsaticum DSM 44478 = JCM 12374]